MKQNYDYKNKMMKVLRWIASIYLILFIAMFLSEASFISALCLLAVLFFAIRIHIDFEERINSYLQEMKNIYVINIKMN